MKGFLLAVWNFLIDSKNKIRLRILFAKDKRFVRKHKAPSVMSIEETLKRIAEENLSVARFGDGEIKLADNRNISFQKADPVLCDKLRQVLRSSDEGFLVCVPDVFLSTDYMTESASSHWKKHLLEFRRVWYSLLPSQKPYGNAFLSRCYMILKDKSRSAEYFALMKQIWDGKDILLVEGEKSRLGIGNDLFDNASSVSRILGPVSGAFGKYDELLETAVNNGRDKLILLALGPTSSVMAYDLWKQGLTAVDLGHADIEYEWFLKGATVKTPVRNKYVNEAGAGRGVGELDDEEYLKQIIAKVI